MKKLFSFLIVLVALIISRNVQAQNTFPTTGSAGIGTTTPNASSLLEMVSTTKGILVPRMTLKQRNEIVSPATGLLIYQTNNTPGFYYYDGSLWKAITPKANWSLTGNGGTNPATNFIGTTDVQPLIFKVNSQKAGYLDYNNNNTGFGVQTLIVATGEANTANGFNALYTNTVGYNNTANGAYVLYSNSKGHNNTANGYRALFTNTTGYYNAATGAFALENNIDGVSNTANGISALRFNTNGSNNTAAGANTLFYNTTGYSNVAIGSNSLFNNIVSHNNVAVGDSALYVQNVATGFNTAVGSKTLYSTTYGHGNTALGSGALFYNVQGNNNTGIGSSALSYNISGSFNTAVGTLADVNNGNYTNSSAFGYYSAITASNQVRVGNSSVTSIGGYQSWTTLPSDKRVKKNIKENVPGLAFINKLKPVTYNIDINAIENIIQRSAIKDKDGKAILPSQQELDSRKAKEQILFTGFVAQDVAAAASSINYDFSGVDKPKNDKDLYGIRYSDFVVPLVKAVQELSAKNDDLQKQIDDLKAIIISSNQINTATTNSKLQTTNLSSSLAQNIPNPFSNTTTISYRLPQNFSFAQIIITDKSGKVLKQVNISGSSKGSVQVNAATLAAGAYQYSLFVDGKLIDTKQMILAK